MNIKNFLAKKLYFSAVGILGTVASILGFSFLLRTYGNYSHISALFISVFVTVFVRSFYESMVIYEAPFKYLSFFKMGVLALVCAGGISGFIYFFQKSLENLTVPFAIAFMLVLVGKVKSYLWGQEEQGIKDTPEYCVSLGEKLKIFTGLFYGFFGFLALFTYILVNIMQVNFFYAIGVSFGLGLLCEEIGSLILIYQQALRLKLLLWVVIRSVLCAFFVCELISIFMKIIMFPPAASTIIGVIVVKLLALTLFYFDHYMWDI
jgi:hypothetical protein